MTKMSGFQCGSIVRLERHEPLNRLSSTSFCTGAGVTNRNEALLHEMFKFRLEFEEGNRKGDWTATWAKTTTRKWFMYTNWKPLSFAHNILTLNAPKINGSHIMWQICQVTISGIAKGSNDTRQQVTVRGQWAMDKFQGGLSTINGVTQSRIKEGFALSQHPSQGGRGCAATTCLFWRLFWPV